jgi:hypothetical protein
MVGLADADEGINAVVPERDHVPDLGLGIIGHRLQRPDYRRPPDRVQATGAPGARVVRAHPQLAAAGDIEIRVNVNNFSFSKDFGDVPVSLASATAHDTAGPAVIKYCGADRTLLSVVLLIQGPATTATCPRTR